MKKETKKEIFFVQIRDPSGTRKEVLETLRSIIGMMQKFEKLKQMRHEKLEKIHSLRVLVRQTHRLMGELKTRMPQTDLKVELPKQKKEEPKVVKPLPKKEEKPKRKVISEIDRLEYELKDIEGKLRTL